MDKIKYLLTFFEAENEAILLFGYGYVLRQVNDGVRRPVCDKVFDFADMLEGEPAGVSRGIRDALA